MVCYIWAHNLSREKICEHELEDTIIVPMAIAAISQSVLKPDSHHSRSVFNKAVDWLSMTKSQFVDCMGEVRESFVEIQELFGLSSAGTVGFHTISHPHVRDGKPQEYNTFTLTRGSVRAFFATSGPGDLPGI